MADLNAKGLSAWRTRAHEIIFEADTPLGKAFDIILIVSIVLSVVAVMLESVSEIEERHGTALRIAEWSFTVLFTVEYLFRLISVSRPTLYARSFFGLVDLLAILPTYLALVIPNAQALLVIRTLRILRVFRVLKLAQYVSESEMLIRALHASRRKIAIFVFSVLMLVIVFGSLMYLIEGREHGFTSIPRGVYWAVVTMTTVGYGDISPQTDLGQTVAMFIMIMGYGIIAVPTGIVTAEFARAARPDVSNQACTSCGIGIHYPDSQYCRRCGAKLE